MRSDTDSSNVSSSTFPACCSMTRRVELSRTIARTWSVPFAPSLSAILHCLIGVEHHHHRNDVVMRTRKRVEQSWPAPSRLLILLRLSQSALIWLLPGKALFRRAHWVRQCGTKVCRTPVLGAPWSAKECTLGGESGVG